MTPPLRNWRARRLALGAFALLGLGAFAVLVLVRECESRSRSLLPPMSSSVSVLRPTPNVLTAVRDLARLETVSFHMERVMDLTDKQARLFGLLQSEDALLLVAVAEVSAGINLQQLTAADVVVDEEQQQCRIELPAPQIFRATLDNARTYVHTRRTDMLARRRENLETRARQEAELALLEAAREAGILPRAADNARRVVEGLVRSLGCAQVEVRVRER